MDRTKMEEMLNELYDVLIRMDTQEDCKYLLEDLCTIKELEQMAQRARAARLLKEGDTYMQIIEKTDISSATLSRISKSLRYGEGYKKFILPEKHV